MVKFIVNELPKQPRCYPACSFRTYIVPFCNIIDRTCLFDDGIGKCEFLMSMDEYNEEKRRKERVDENNKLIEKYNTKNITRDEFLTMIGNIIEDAGAGEKGE